MYPAPAKDFVQSVVLTFKYQKPLLTLMFIGVAILFIMGLAFPSIAVYLIRHRAHLSLEMKLDLTVFGFMGLWFLWLVGMILRTWYTFLTVYVLTESGVTVNFFSSETFLPWTQLSTARYRRAMGQLELRFHAFPRFVVLNNVDMNMRRATLLAGLRLVERMSRLTIRRTIA